MIVGASIGAYFGIRYAEKTGEGVFKSSIDGFIKRSEKPVFWDSRAGTLDEYISENKDAINREQWTMLLNFGAMSGSRDVFSTALLNIRESEDLNTVIAENIQNVKRYPFFAKLMIVSALSGPEGSEIDPQNVSHKELDRLIEGLAVSK